MGVLARVLRDVRRNRGRRLKAALVRPLPWRSSPALRQTYSSAFGSYGAVIWSELPGLLRSAGIPVVTGGQAVATHRRLNVRDTDLATVLRTVHQMVGDDRVVVELSSRRRRLLRADYLDQIVEAAYPVDLLIPERDVESWYDRDPLPCSVIEIVAWGEWPGPYDSTYLESSRANTVAARLPIHVFERLADESHEFAARLPPADLPDFPVDIVYTWVDGDDPAWLERKRDAYHSGEERAGPERVAHPERYRSRDELKYSLRSVEEFAPWVRRIHIVTDSQCPEWLDLDHPKIRLVDHREIFSNGDWLPTFNSSSIETQLHHVPELAQKFLYFNDDFFLGQPCDVSDFFLGNGVLKYFPSGQMAYEAGIDASSEEYIRADKNAIDLIARDFRAVNRQIMLHAPYPSDRELLGEIECRYADEFAACASSRFRSGKDIRPIAFMQYHYGFHRRMAIPGRISHRYIALWKPQISEQLENLSMSRRYKTFCINDVGLQDERTASVDGAIAAFLQSYFPTKSSFER
jgi:hypothetical protein